MARRSRGRQALGNLDEVEVDYAIHFFLLKYTFWKMDGNCISALHVVSRMIMNA